MPASRSKSPAPEHPELDVDTLIEQLRNELVREREGSDPRARILAWRQQAERMWRVSAERPLRRRPGLKGALALPVKKLLRPFLRWYVEPLAAEQRTFNEALLHLLDVLSEQLDRGVAESEKATRTLGELDDRLTRVERRPIAADAQPKPRGDVSQAPVAAPPFPDYFAFEARMRGSTAEVRERQRVYVEDFRDAAPVLDLGCGRGEFLGLLRDAGIDARGVDVDADMVAYARGEGLAVEQQDLLACLEAEEDEGLGGIFAAQVVEHLPVPALFRMLELSARKLRPDGLLVAETINPLSPLALHSYFADLTHAQPLVPETLALLAKQAGFRAVDVRFLNAPRHVDDIDDRIREILFAPLDYAIVART